MRIELDPLEARVIGAMLEKEVATPEQYPLSLNALTSACNQKSSRDPVMDLDEATVQNAVDALKKRYLIREKTGYGSRVSKYHYRLYNDEIGDFRFDTQELALVCLLLLRGPQTPGELRSRAGRLCDFEDVAQVEAALERLMTYEQGPFVARLPREPGRRVARYAHLFSGDVVVPETPEPRQPLAAAPEDARLSAMEERLGALEAELAELRAMLAGRDSSDRVTNTIS